MLTRGNGFVLMVLIGVMAAASAAHSQAQPYSTVELGLAAVSLDSIVLHIEEARVRNKQRMREYVVTREYKLFDGENEANDPEQKPSSSVIARLEFVPPNQKTFQIERVEGSARGKSIVQHILEGESAQSGKGPATLTRDNYEFTLIGEDLLNGRPCWVLGLKPRRDDKNMIKGRAWIDKDTYLVQQVQGELAKTPSWWLKKVDMTVRFGDAAGMWLPTGSYAVADVRFFGKHVLTSQAVEIRTSDQVATSFSSIPQLQKRHERLRGFPPIMGTGVYVHR